MVDISALLIIPVGIGSLAFGALCGPSVNICVMLVSVGIGSIGFRDTLAACGACLAAGESAIMCPSPRHVLKDTHDHSFYLARSE
jgi:hypothetical protein